MLKVYSKRKNTPKAYRNPPRDAVLVDRTTDWGNPFKVGRDGNRTLVIKKFEYYARQRLADEPNWLDPLRGRDLICWCAPLPCHADVLLQLANT